MPKLSKAPGSTSVASDHVHTTKDRVIAVFNRGADKELSKHRVKATNQAWKELFAQVTTVPCDAETVENLFCIARAAGCYTDQVRAAIRNSESELWLRPLRPAQDGIFSPTVLFERDLWRKRAVQRYVADLGLNPEKRGDPLAVRLVCVASAALSSWLGRDVTYKLQDDFLLCQPQLPVNTTTIQLQEPDGVVEVICGASGMGKTFAAIIAGATDADVMGVTVYLRVDDLQWTDEPEYGRPEKKEARNKAALTAVDAALSSMATWLPQPSGGVKTVPKSIVTLVFDEMGLQRNLTRAIISQRTAINDRVKAITCASSSRIVIVGTGSSSVVLAPGSLPGDYRTHVPSTAPVWSTFLANSSLPRSLVNTLQTPVIGSEQARAAEAGSTNVRLAALLVRALRQLCDYFRCIKDTVSWDCVVSTAMLVATKEFKTMNGLANVPNNRYVITVANALATAFVQHLPPAIYDLSVVRHGLVWDAAKRKQSPSNDAAAVPTAADDDATAFDLDPMLLGQRFFSTHANVLMAEVFANIGLRHSSGGESSEEFLADWLLWSLAMSGQVVELLRAGPALRLPSQPNANDQHGWMSPAEFQLKLLFTPGEDAKQTVVATLSSALTCESSVADVRQALMTCDKGDSSTTGNNARPFVSRSAARRAKRRDRTAEAAGPGEMDVIAINKATAPFADIVVFRRSRRELLLIQSKRFMATTMDERSVNDELHKMGLVTNDTLRDSAVAQLEKELERPKPHFDGETLLNAEEVNAWAGKVEAWLGPKISSKTYCVSDEVKRSAGCWMALSADLKAKDIRFSAPALNLWTSQFTWVDGEQPATVHYVIVVFATAPRPYTCDLPSNVHLVHAPCRDSVPGVSVHAGFYPIGYPDSRSAFVKKIDTSHAKPPQS